ncbi:MAG TPA: 5-oxoprolinase subunit PxpA [Luteolibacter sp.]
MTGSLKIDLNCDLGEGSPHDAELMPLITSANIACGAHAGDEATMRRCISLAIRHGVAIGAHPGYADPDYFGRRELELSLPEVFQLVQDQVRLLQALATAQGASLSHVKPHGALYNQAARDPLLATAIAEAVRQLDPSLVVFGLAGSELPRAARAIGLQAAEEVFADRTYRADGTLTERNRPDALIEDPDIACGQVLRMIHDGLVRTVDGIDFPVHANTVCLHGESPGAVAFARRLHEALRET